MSLWLALLGSLAFVRVASAAQCWQDTPCSGPETASFPGPWESNIYSPESRTVSPTRVLDENHNVLNGWPGRAFLQGNGSMLIFDFGKEVGGLLTVEYTACGTGTLGVAFSEASNFTGSLSDESNGGTGPDGALYAEIQAAHCGTRLSYTTPDPEQRGGFRYLTLYTLTNSTSISASVTSIDVEISFQPTWSNLRAYGGYFDSSDEVLNKIWYAGAYTIQTTTVPSDAGRVYPCLNTGWLNDAQLGTNASAVIVDGAKRDRASWAGDLGIATRSAMVSTGDLASVKSALEVQYTYQQDTGELPMVGPPINFFGSDTYHMATLIGTYDYVLFSGDMEFLNSNWEKYQNAVAFVMAKIDDTGMMDVTGTSNWGRTAPSGGHATDGNMLLYRSLVTGSIMAQWQGNSSLSTQWAALGESLKAAVNQNNWDDAVGAFINSDTDSTIYPEDGNSMALYFNGTLSAAYSSNTSTYLQSNWGPVGAITPELPGNVVPYIESFEVKGHLASGNTQRALDLMRLSWGWYLSNPYGTQSTMLEGYYTDGSFRYRDASYNMGGAYTSHSHGWSTGPTDALTTYVVGLQFTAPGGKQWVLAPQFGDLEFAEAGYTVPLGKFSAGWAVTKRGYTITLDVPACTAGTLRLPFSGRKPSSVVVDSTQAAHQLDDTEGVIILTVNGGKHQVDVSY